MSGHTCDWRETESDDVLAFGHTHDPWFRWYGEKLFVNVGSVGRPKDGDTRAMYVVLSSSAEAPVDVEIRRVEYDVEAAARAVLAAGLPAALADMLAPRKTRRRSMTDE